MPIVYTIKQLNQSAKGHIIDAIKKAGGTTQDFIRAADTLSEHQVRPWGYVWKFDGGEVSWHAAFDEWTTVLEETCQQEKEDSPNSIPTSSSSREQPLATSRHGPKSSVTTTPVTGFA